MIPPLTHDPATVLGWFIIFIAVEIVSILGFCVAAGRAIDDRKDAEHIKLSFVLTGMLFLMFLLLDTFYWAAVTGRPL